MISFKAISGATILFCGSKHARLSIFAQNIKKKINLDWTNINGVMPLVPTPLSPMCKVVC